MWPVIIRELRVGSRHWTTYWLRVFAASAVIAGAFHVWLLHQGMAKQGGPFFARLHQVLFVAIWILVPLMTADCLSKEKREGTLGLLFMTALSPREIVLAKATAHGLRALSLWIAVLPITTVPFLLGGLGWWELAFSILLNLSSICLALGAGVVASSQAKSWQNAITLAAALAVCCWTAMFFWLGVSFFRFTPFGRQGSWADHIGAGLIFAGDGFGAGVWPDMALRGFFNLKAALISCVCCFLGSLLFLAFLLHVAALSLRRNWQERPKTKRRTQVEAVFYTPVIAVRLFRRWMRRKIERNPIGWLEQRSWAGRMTAWVWLALMISFSTMLSYPSLAADFYLFNVLGWMLLITIACVAAGSFRRERETGAMELILVTPLSAREIVMGRLRGIWEQFLPAFIVWIALVLYLSSVIRTGQYSAVAIYRWRDVPSTLPFFAVTFATLPVVGLYFSLVSRHILLAWTATLIVGLLLPQMLAVIILIAVGVFSTGDFSTVGYDRWGRSQVAMTIEILLAFALAITIQRKLIRRDFSFR